MPKHPPKQVRCAAQDLYDACTTARFYQSQLPGIKPTQKGKEPHTCYASHGLKVYNQSAPIIFVFLGMRLTKGVMPTLNGVPVSPHAILAWLRGAEDHDGIQQQMVSATSDIRCCLPDASRRIKPCLRDWICSHAKLEAEQYIPPLTMNLRGVGVEYVCLGMAEKCGSNRGVDSKGRKRVAA
jgi:hypothetical protein